jgi:TonB family protein
MSVRRLIAPFLLAASVAHPAIGQVPGGRDIVGTARDLYASARYDEALAVLNDSSVAVSDRKSIEQYRSLCLLALGRGTEAESAIAAVITVDPTYLPGDAEASPRVRAAFSDVRKRLLPELAGARYLEAKSSYDRKEYAVAVQQFKAVVALLDDPDMGGRLADLRTLASGFTDLAAAAAAPPPAPKAEPKAAMPAPPAAPQPEPNRIYTMLDADVLMPRVIRQDMPTLSQTVKAQARDRGIIEVVIDEQGRVSFAAIRSSVHPMYDASLLTAAREWRYQPASLAGKPVKYRKMIQINVSRN